MNFGWPLAAAAAMPRRPVGGTDTALSSERTQSIRHPTIVKLFVDYFDSIWRAATPLKQGDVVSKELLEKIEATVEKFSSPQKPTPLPTSLKK